MVKCQGQHARLKDLMPLGLLMVWSRSATTCFVAQKVNIVRKELFNIRIMSCCGVK